MRAPHATYRLQFRNGMDFAAAAGLTDYLARLGVSHLYASPLFAAAPDSTHGYDGIDFAAMEPAIGGEPGFAAMSDALDGAGLGLLLDFVPNHMAALEANPWWRSVLEWGEASPFAEVFDIDWSAPAILLPWLGVPYEAALRDGLFAVVFDAETSGFAFSIYDRRFPITPPSYPLLLERVRDPAVAALAGAARGVGLEDAATLKRRLIALTADPACAAAIEAGMAAASRDRDLLHRLHEAQHWRLAFWRLGRERLTWRRFFEIAELVCLRVEDLAVFDRVHARLLELIASGRVHGVRVDHIDGLADPKGYLERFRRVAGDGAPFWLLVEKILEPGEALRPDWPVAGTTGYEFIAALAGLFVDRRKAAEMSAAYNSFTGAPTDYADSVRRAKRRMLEHNLAAERKRLIKAVRRHPASRMYGDDALSEAIVALAANMPVYRTYIDATGPGEADLSLIAEVERSAAEFGPAVGFVAGLLRGEGATPEARAAAHDFAVRFQQVTGPVMAKAVEDTVFYRDNRLVALNEVGGAPDQYGAPLAAFHDAMSDRLATQPSGLSATATHDTKRGEDARARLYVLSECPGAWARAVARWAAINAPHRATLPGGPAPEPAMEWMFYQALAGAWPADFAADPADDRLTAFRIRMQAYMTKAIREAKLRTSWTESDADYEGAVAAFIDGVLGPDTGHAFMTDFAQTCRSIWVAGAVNGLAQLAVKLAAPGVPDFYQGSEVWDFSLVDPDNRAPVDFGARRRLLDSAVGMTPEALLAEWRTGIPKMALTAAGLGARARHPALFRDGAYLQLNATGISARHVLAFARSFGGEAAILIAPRFVHRFVADAGVPLPPASCWGDAAVPVPEILRGRRLTDVVTGRRYETGIALPLAETLSQFPAALLVTPDSAIDS